MHRASIAAAVADCLDAPLDCRVLGSSPVALYLSAQPMAIAMTAPGVPDMPNGIAMPSELPVLPTGATVTLDVAALRWADGAIAWDPVVVDRSIGSHGPQPWLLERLAHLEGYPASPLGQEFHAAISDGAEPDELAMRFTGRGGGLTPEGDDLLAAFAGATLALGAHAEWVARMATVELDRLTTQLSATLLTLAVRGRCIGPYIDLLEEHADWRLAIERLASLGHSTGRAYLAGAAAAADLQASMT